MTTTDLTETTIADLRRDLDSLRLELDTERAVDGRWSANVETDIDALWDALRARQAPAAEPVPTVGRIVLYRLTESEAAIIRQRRQDAKVNLSQHRNGATGVQIHVGNSVHEGQVFPLVITAIFNPDSPALSVNGQLLLDGNDCLWVTSRPKGDAGEFGTWSWPTRA
jgi:hypothetical protein